MESCPYARIAPSNCLGTPACRPRHTVAEGNGPVNAIDIALRKALEPSYPVLKDMQLVDYRVRILHASDASGAMPRVLIESAYFEPASIRKTSKKFGLNTDASHRFERGTDPNSAQRANDRAAQLMVDIAGGRLVPGIIDEYPEPVAEKHRARALTPGTISTS